MVSEKFCNLNTNFLEKFYNEFDDCEENKLIYTDIFQMYGEQVEKFIEKELKAKVVDFNMNAFEKELM